MQYNINLKAHWVKILKYYEKECFIRNGLTIPFLVGIFKDSYIGDKEDLLKNFLRELKNLVDLGYIKISYCSYLEEDVVSTISLVFPIWMTYSIKMNDEKIAEYIEKYDSIIKDDLFSKVSNEWSQYTKLDIERIKEANEKVV